MYKNTGNDQRQQMMTPAGSAAPGYTPSQIESLRIKLNKQLGPEYISIRKGPGYSSVQYLEGWKAINLANQIFGPNGWNTELKTFQVDFIDEKHGSINMGISCIVRVILKDGTYHEDVGYGSIENCKNKSMAFDKCKKEAVTDGMKRALRQFGNALGNCLYDKEFLKQITKVNSEPVKFDATDLIRRSTTIPRPVEPNDEAEVWATHSKTESAVVNTGVVKPLLITNLDPQVLKPVAKQNSNLQPNPNTPLSSNTTLQLNANSTCSNPNPKPISNNTKPAVVPAIPVTKNNVQMEGPMDELMGEQMEEVADEQEVISQRKDESFIFSDDWPYDVDDEKILNSNNFSKNEDIFPGSDFEEDNDNSGDGDVAMNDVNTEKSTFNNENKPENQVAIPENKAIIPEHVTFVSATSADTIQQDPTLQRSLKYDVSYTSSQMNKSSFINHSKSLPVKKSLVKSDDNKENKMKKVNTSMTGSSTGSVGVAKPSVTKVNANTSYNISANNLNSNPIAKRSFGLPPNKLANKRLKK